MLAVGRCVGDDGTVLGGAHLERNWLGVFYLNGFFADGDIFPLVHELILRAIGVERFDEQVLHVGAGIGDSPGNVSVVTDLDARQARQ